jgi:hypothetical protein
MFIDLIDWKYLRALYYGSAKVEKIKNLGLSAFYNNQQKLRLSAIPPLRCGVASIRQPFSSKSLFNN